MENKSLPNNKLFSILVPFFQNEKNVADIIDKLVALIPKLEGISVEIVCVDDGSTDGTRALLQEARERYPQWISLVKLSRNFGQTPAIQAGLHFARGDCVGIISADLQEDPQAFIELIKKWKAGSKYVIAERVGRQETRRHQFISGLYWWILRRSRWTKFPELGYDCCLLDRQLINDLNQMNERNTSIFPLIYWLGYESTRVPIIRTVRKRGHSQWSLRKKIKFTIDTLIAFTSIPSRFVTYSGIFASLVSALYMVRILILWLIQGSTVPGWMSIVGVILLQGGLILFALGVICEYLWRCLDEVRRRPPYIVEEVKTAQLTQ